MSESADFIFSEAVKAEQARLGARQMQARRDALSKWKQDITPDLAAFLAARKSFYLVTASKAGQPYIQHRGGPEGFIQVTGPRQIAFADFPGNKQYITLGNLKENPKAYIFLMDYPTRQRIKLWGEARVVEDDPALLAKTAIEGVKLSDRRALVFDITAWDINCPSHITPLYEEAVFRAATAQFVQRIAELEAEVVRLKGG